MSEGEKERGRERATRWVGGWERKRERERGRGERETIEALFAWFVGWLAD